MDYLQYEKMVNDLSVDEVSFKPCYKWITFNTRRKRKEKWIQLQAVLNLVINGLPSIQFKDWEVD